MKGYSIKVISCRRCFKDFERHHAAVRFCGDCKDAAALETSRRKDAAYRSRNKDNPEFRRKRTERTRDYVARNKDAVAEYQRAYAARRSDHKKTTARKWREENPLLHAESSRRQREREKAAGYPHHKSERAKQKRRAREGAKRAEDPAFVINDRMSVNIRLSIREQKAGRGWEGLVGFTLADLMAHLERQFCKGMSWDNIGQWHIDHIIPKSAFSYQCVEDPDFRACWALTNLRPLWAEDNLRKHAKVLTLV